MTSVSVDCSLLPTDSSWSLSVISSPLHWQVQGWSSAHMMARWGHIKCHFKQLSRESWSVVSSGAGDWSSTDCKYFSLISCHHNCCQHTPDLIHWFIGTINTETVTVLIFKSDSRSGCCCWCCWCCSMLIIDASLLASPLFVQKAQSQAGFDCVNVLSTFQRELVSDSQL